MSAKSAPVAIIMGSRSDWPVLRHAADILEGLGVGFEAKSKLHALMRTLV